MLKKTVFFAAALMFVAAFVFAAGDAVACGNNASKASDTKMIGDKSACGAKTGEAKLTEARMIGDKSACGAKMGMIDAQTAGAKMTEGKMSQPMDFEGTLGFSRIRLTPSSRSEFARARSLVGRDVRRQR